MRVIFSRKGFDSAYGKVPSPILPDGRMISLPIPDKDAPTTYGAIQREGINFGDLVSDLTRGKTPHKHRAHLDPDLVAEAMPRLAGWRPIFGQSGAARGHLHNQNVAPGDLFLFFGWFRQAHLVSDQWRYVRNGKDIHALWGWMQVGSIHSCRSVPDDVAMWAAGHPHLSGPRLGDDDVIIAADDLVVAGRCLRGAGVFTSRPERILTLAGATRSIWRMPAWMSPDAGVARLSCHDDRERWLPLDAETCRLSSVSIGQEFVLSTTRSDLLDAWLAVVFADVPSI
jgi:Nucleotide modification associated domain 3